MFTCKHNMAWKGSKSNATQQKLEHGGNGWAHGQTVLSAANAPAFLLISASSSFCLASLTPFPAPSAIITGSSVGTYCSAPMHAPKRGTIVRKRRFSTGNKKLATPKTQTHAHCFHTQSLVDGKIPP